MRKLSTEARAAILSALVEGNSLASTSRMCRASKITILRLLADAGTLALQYHDLTVCGLKTKRVQCDEIWAFCHCKKVNTPAHLEGVFGVGDIWTWTALDPDSKLMLHWMVGQRDAGDANKFMAGLAPRLACKIQITTDGLKAYKNAIGNYFDVDTRSDYAQCIKKFGDAYGEGKYSPGECTGVEVKVCWGDPDPDHITTSHVERTNLTMRMGIRRFTRLTNGFSKTVENHRHAIAIHYFYYNFIRRHMTIKTTPAVMAGVAEKPWTMEDFVRLMEREEELLGGRISDYKPAGTVAAKKKAAADLQDRAE